MSFEVVPLEVEKEVHLETAHYQGFPIIRDPKWLKEFEKLTAQNRWHGIDEVIIPYFKTVDFIQDLLDKERRSILNWWLYKIYKMFKK